MKIKKKQLKNKYEKLLKMSKECTKWQKKKKNPI